MTQLTLNYAVISDIHFFNRRTPTAHIVKALWAWLDMYSKYLYKCNVLFIAGDTFDRFIPSHYPDIPLVNRFFYTLGKLLKGKNIKLRVLEGTATHDRKQFYTILPILEATGVDVKYHTTVCVEDIDGTSVLYVPDNWKTDMHETYLDAQAAITAIGRTHIDIAIMHGSFEYQLPMMPHVNFCQQDFESIVTHRIHVGHVHLPSHKGKVYAQGSFDRLSHGEPGDKGGHICIGKQVKRLPNVNEFPYESLYLPGLLDTDIITLEKHIREKAELMRYTGWLRLQGNKYHLAFEHLPKLQHMFPGIKFERQYVTEATVTVDAPNPVVSHLSIDSILVSIKEAYPSLPNSAYDYIHDKLHLAKLPDQP